MATNSVFDFLASTGTNYGIYIKSLSNQNVVNQENQLFTGIFFVYFPNRQYFIGKLQNCYPTQGILVFKEKCYYVGKIKQLNAQGQGQYINQQNGYKYQGSWSKNLQHNQGRQYYQNGDTFKGNFTYGYKFGQGLYKFNDGRIYEGNYYNGMCDGLGTYKLTNNKEWYQGQWKLGEINGKGQYHYANGDKYEGQFSKGLKHGHGKYTFTEGYLYQGQWTNGLMHGKGAIKQGYDQIQGQWHQGKKIK